jgi:hypothetical protein
MIDWVGVFKTIDWSALFKTLGSTTIIVGALAFVAQAAIKHLLTRDIAKHKEALTFETQKQLLALKKTADEQLLTQKNTFDTQMESFKAEADANAARKDRIREQVTQWANPILDAIRGLETRLNNILSDGGYFALSNDTQSKVNPEWSITYDYFYPTTIYLFSQYFCWIRLFEENLSFELFTAHPEKDSFLEKVREVERTLSAYPMKELSDLTGTGDRQIFRLQQRAMGETLATSQETSGPRCMRVSDFLEKWKEPNFSPQFSPLTQFVDRLRPEDKFRWKRLQLMQSALQRLRRECEHLLRADERI